MTINERMKLVREEAGDNFTQCGERIGISRSAVSMIESGTNKPSRQTVELFCREYGVNREWLETGEGDMRPLATSDFDDLLSQLVEFGNQHGNRASIESIGFVLRWYMKMTDSEREFLDAVIHAAVETTKKDPE